MSVCKDCGREIDWMRTAEGKYIPVDPGPVFAVEGDGDELFYTGEGWLGYARKQVSGAAENACQEGVQT